MNLSIKYDYVSDNMKSDCGKDFINESCQVGSSYDIYISSLTTAWMVFCPELLNRLKEEDSLVSHVILVCQAVLTIIAKGSAVSCLESLVLEI